MVYRISCNQMAFSRTDSCDELDALIPQEWMTSSERHQANTKSASGHADIGWNEAHRREWKASLNLRASAGLESISCMRPFSSSSPHRLHSAHLLIFSASAAFGSSPHRLRIGCIRLVSSSSLHQLQSAVPGRHSAVHLRMRLFHRKVSPKRFDWERFRMTSRRSVGI
jgi:hypothetical protein